MVMLATLQSCENLEVRNVNVWWYYVTKVQSSILVRRSPFVFF